MRLFSELKRRNVFRMAALYLVAAWLIMQVAEVLITLGGLPAWSGQLVLAVLAIGFPIALIFSWFYELTPEGIALEKEVDRAESITHVTGRRMDFVVIAMLCAALLLFAYDKWWPEGPMEQSIAVLAFENLSNDPEQEYFSDGVSEEILNLLAQIKPLKVIARTSSFSFKDKDADVATIAERLNVSHVLEGSVRRSGERVRITAQLIDATDSTHVWSQTYDRELDEIFKVQDEIASSIARALTSQLTPELAEREKSAVIRSASAEAYDAYLRGRERFRARGRAAVEQATEHFERALRLDETFAPAHAYLAIATTMLGNYNVLSLEEVRRIAVPHLDRAQELDPELAEAHAGRGFLAGISGDPATEVEHLRKALASNPSDSFAMNSMHISLNLLGRWQEAEVALKQMLVIDPLTFVGRFNYAEWLARTMRCDEAHDMADELSKQHLGMGLQSHAQTSLIYEGDIAEGLSWGLKFGRKRNLFSYHAFWAFVWIGEYEEARRIDDEIMVGWVDLHRARLDDSLLVAQNFLQTDPNNLLAIHLAAASLYEMQRYGDAVQLYERLARASPDGRPISAPWPLIESMHMASALLRTGDQEGGHATADIVRQDLAARRGAGMNYWNLHAAEAQLAAFDGDHAHTIAALESAVRTGARHRTLLDDPVFEAIRKKPGFVAVRQQLDTILSKEREDVLQLICFNNPVPDNWRPLPETCEGVVRAGS